MPAGANGLRPERIVLYYATHILAEATDGTRAEESGTRGSGPRRCLLYVLDHSHPELKNAKYVVFVNSKRQYVDCSVAVAELLGYSREEMLRKTVDDLSCWRDELPGLFQTYMRKRRLDGEHVVSQRSGAPLPIRYRSFVFADGCKGSLLEEISDWRRPYRAAFSRRDPAKRGMRIDVALAAIYQAVYVGGSQRMWESRAIVEALSKISKIRKPNGSVLNPAFLAFEKTRLALLRLADNAENPEATEVLLRENRRVIEAVVKETLGTQDEEKMLATVLERVGHKARYYDPEENPVVWLQGCLRLECRRWKAEMR